VGASRAVELLREYVAIPSVNPMGRDDLPPAHVGERRLAEHVREQLRRLGLDAELVGAGERRGVLAEVRPAGASASRDAVVLVASHLDTVPVDGMEIDPFDPRLEAGRLYGRGACDTKGGLAALVAALERVLKGGGRLRRRVIVLGEADEEYASAGVADALAALGPRRPDWVLATEPTGLRLATAHKGIGFARLEAHGLACHASDPTRGRNALYGIARAALALEKLGAELRGRVDPQLGSATLSVGRMGGGHAPNVVPDRAWLVVDRRLLPGESAEAMHAEIVAALARDGVPDVEVVCHEAKPPLDTDRSHPGVRACQATLAALGLPDAPTPVAFGTDAGVFAGHGVPGVVMGPGSIEQAHTAREWVDVREVEQMEAFFARLLETPPGR
jgi:acetylornithine deacetylase